MWKIYAILSALFAALTAIFAKIGVRDIPSNLATAIRTIIILLLTWGIVFFAREQSMIKDINRHTWLFLILSGVATGLSWLFYFKALQSGEVSRVAPIDKLSVVITIPQRTGKPESDNRSGIDNGRQFVYALEITTKTAEEI